MSLLIKTSKQSALYMIFQVVGLGISFISFPIMTRIFSVEEYGNLALINTTLLLIIAFTKGGITTSFIRHYPEFISEEEKKYLYSSALGGGILIAIVVMFVYSAILFLLRQHIEDHLVKILLIVGSIILFRNMQNIFASFFRAEERVIVLNIVGLLYKVGPLSLGILISLILIKSLYGYFVGVIIFEAFMIIGISFMFYKRKILEPKAVSTEVFKKLYYYGIPLTIFEISSLINHYSDRFLIKYFLDSTQLGVYSAGYSIAMYSKEFLTAPIWMSVFPIYTKLWESEGREKTEEFLTQLLKYYFCIGVLIFFGVSLLSKELITTLATEKYVPASQIIPYIVGSIIIYGSSPIISAGLYLLKQTKKMAFYTIICAALNMVLNLYLIPKYNIMGAAYSSVISYMLLTVLIAASSNKFVKVSWPLRDLMFYISFGALMGVILSNIHLGGNMANLVFKSLLGLFIYGICIIIYDGKVRKQAFSYIKSTINRV